MSSVEMEVKCSHCDFAEATLFFDNRRLTKNTICSRCGYYQGIDLQSGKTERGGGFGGYRINYGSISRTGVFSRRLPLPKRIVRLQRTVRNPRVQAVEITAQVRGKWQTLNLKSKSPTQKLKDRRNEFAFAAKVRAAEARPPLVITDTDEDESPIQMK